MKLEKFALMIAGLGCLAAAGCGSDDGRAPAGGTAAPAPTPSPTSTVGDNPNDTNVVPNGIWGGMNSSLSVAAQGANFRYNCASGLITSRMVTSSTGFFDLPGTLTEDDGRQFVARYRGQVNGTRMTLNVSYVNDAGNTIQYNDTLTFGFEGPLPVVCPQ